MSYGRFAYQRPPVRKLYLDPTDGPSMASDAVTNPETTNDRIAFAPYSQVRRRSLWFRFRFAAGRALARLAWHLLP